MDNKDRTTTENATDTDMIHRYAAYMVHTFYTDMVHRPGTYTVHT